MSEHSKASHWGNAALGLLALLVLAGLVMSTDSLRNFLVAAAGKVTLLSVLATLPGQIAAMLICAAALWALQPGVGFGACFASRVLRDASGNLPIAPPGFSAIVGARALVLAGGETRAAISASALDKAAEIVSQFPFIALAVVVMWNAWPMALRLPPESGLIALGLAIAAGPAGAMWFKFGAGSRLAARLASEARKLLVEARRQQAGMPLALLLHGIAWLSGGLQLWMAAYVLGFELTLYEGIAMESAAYAARGLFFFIPAGLAAQEAGLVAAGLIFGLGAEQALALGLVLRLRDVVFAGGLVLWPVMEWRRKA